MSPIEAVIYCEEHLCCECIVTKENIETRSVADVLNGVPCLINLIRLRMGEEE